MSTYATDNPQTMTGTGGAAPLLSAMDWSKFALPQQLGLPGGPPADAHVDATYLASEAGLRSDIEKKYGDLMQQLGYTDPQTGQFIPGTLMQNAQLVQDQAEQQRQQAILQNTQNAQQQGILFSGRRGTMQAEAESPYLQQIAESNMQLPQDMAQAYGNAADLVNQYTTQNDLYLADAADRYSTAQQNQPTAAPVAASSPTNVTPTPPPPAPPPVDNTFEGIPTGTSGTYRMGTQPFIAMAGGAEVNQPTPALIGENGPEAVVPRTGLSADENRQLTGLRQAAQARMAGNMPSINMRRNDTPGIHWFGPGGAGVAYPPENPPFGPPPVQPPLTPAHALYMAGHHAQAVDQYLAHHTAAMAGRAVMPNWVQHAMANRLRTHPFPGGGGDLHVPTLDPLPPGLLDPSPPIGVLPPGRPVY